MPQAPSTQFSTPYAQTGVQEMSQMLRLHRLSVVQCHVQHEARPPSKQPSTRNAGSGDRLRTIARTVLSPIPSLLSLFGPRPSSRSSSAMAPRLSAQRSRGGADHPTGATLSLSVSYGGRSPHPLTARMAPSSCTARPTHPATTWQCHLTGSRNSCPSFSSSLAGTAQLESPRRRRASDPFVSTLSTRGI